MEDTATVPKPLQYPTSSIQHPIPKLPLDFALTTERLLIRRLRESDAAEVNTAAKAALPELEQWMNGPASLRSLEATQAFIAEGALLALKGDSYRFGAFDKNNGEFLASLDFGKMSGSRAHIWWIGYWCAPRYTGKGLTTEAVRAISAVIMEDLHAVRFVLQCAAENEPSNKLAKRCGFVFEGTALNGYKNALGTLQDTNNYAHTPATWESFNNAR